MVLGTKNIGGKGILECNSTPIAVQDKCSLMPEGNTVIPGIGI
jgi:hypothetical protein